MPRRIDAILLVFATSLALAACADDGEPASGTTLGGPGAGAALDLVAVDSTGAAIVGGRFQGTLDLGGTAPVAAVKQSDGFIARVTRDGDVLWWRAFGGVQPYDVNRDDRVTGIATMADDSIVVTGYAEGVIDLGGGPLGDDGDDVPDPGMPFIARFGADGRHLWSLRWRGDAQDAAAGEPVIGPDGSIYVAAHFWGGTTIAGPHLEFSDETIIVKLSAAGKVLWFRTLRPAPGPAPQPGLYGASHLAITAGGALAVSGALSGPVDLGTGPLAAVEEYRTFVAVLDVDDGHTVAVRAYAEAETPYGDRPIARAPDGTLVLGGPHVTRLAPDLSIASAVDLSELVDPIAARGRIAISASGEVLWVGATAWARLAADGTELAREELAVSGDAQLGDGAFGADGRAVIVGGFRGGFTLAGQPFRLGDDDPSGDGFVAWLP